MRLMNMADRQSATPVTHLQAGFAEGTSIRTEHGARAVETLRPGDKVITRYGKPVAIENVRSMDSHGTVIRVGRNAFNFGTPRRDLFLAPDQLVMLTAPVLEWLFDCTAALIPVRHLTAIRGVEEITLTQPQRMISMDLDAPRIVFGSGLAMATSPLGESHPIRTLSPKDIAELQDHVVELVAAA